MSEARFLEDGQFCTPKPMYNEFCIRPNNHMRFCCVQCQVHMLVLFCAMFTFHALFTSCHVLLMFFFVAFVAQPFFSNFLLCSMCSNLHVVAPVESLCLIDLAFCSSSHVVLVVTERPITGNVSLVQMASHH